MHKQMVTEYFMFQDVSSVVQLFIDDFHWFSWNIKFFFQTEVENCRNMPEQEVKHAEFGWICTNLLILNFSTNMNQEM